MSTEINSKLNISAEPRIPRVLRNFKSSELVEWRAGFLTNGVLIFENLILDETFKLVKAETERMLDFAKRKDIQIESNGISERKMSTVGGKLLKSNSDLLKNLYFNDEILSFLKEVTGEEIHPVLDKNEDIVINCLHKKTDVHGRHIDTYSFAFNLMISSPPPGTGGELAVYSGKQPKAFHISEGSFYLIRTDRYEHEVLNLTSDVQRLVVNMSYSSNDTKDLLSYSSDLLYS